MHAKEVQAGCRSTPMLNPIPKIAKPACTLFENAMLPPTPPSEQSPPWDKKGGGRVFRCAVNLPSSWRLREISGLCPSAARWRLKHAMKKQCHRSSGKRRSAQLASQLARPPARKAVGVPRVGCPESLCLVWAPSTTQDNRDRECSPMSLTMSLACLFPFSSHHLRVSAQLHCPQPAMSLSQKAAGSAFAAVPYCHGCSWRCAPCHECSPVSLVTLNVAANMFASYGESPAAYIERAKAFICRLFTRTRKFMRHHVHPCPHRSSGCCCRRIFPTTFQKNYSTPEPFD